LNAVVTVFCVELTAAWRSLLTLHKMSSLTNMLRNPISLVVKWHWWWVSSRGNEVVYLLVLSTS